LINVKHVLRFLPALLHANTGFVKYFRPEFENFEKANQKDFALIRNALIKATQKTNSRCSIGVLLSGGLDSSLITAIAARLQAESGKITVFQLV
jgi:asparagine synthase (glutamine-hydrolysing)